MDEAVSSRRRLTDWRLRPPVRITADVIALDLLLQDAVEPWKIATTLDLLLQDTVEPWKVTALDLLLEAADTWVQVTLDFLSPVLELS
jgi:hypothetical protein